MVTSEGCAGTIKPLKVELYDVPRHSCTVPEPRNLLQRASPTVKAAAAKKAAATSNAPSKNWRTSACSAVESNLET